MIIPILGFTALGIALLGAIYLFIENGREIRENLKKITAESKK